jgi:SAM-dependent methyltransferase
MDLAEMPVASFRRHPWEVVRARFFRDVLRPVLDPRPSATVLDVGAGDGFFAGTLLDEHAGIEITCFDPGYEAVPADALPERPAGIAFTATEPDAAYDVVTMLDVLEHVDDDERVLGDLVRDRVLPGGHVLISVPAWPRLFSSHDVRLKHFRRYAPMAASTLLIGAGLEVLSRGGLFVGPMAARALGVALERRHGAGEVGDGSHSLEWRRGPAARRLVEGILQADAGLSRLATRAGLQIPGLSWWALCRRP